MDKNIQKQIFKILKSKTEDEIFYVILNMINGTYVYEYKELNTIPYGEMLIYLEKTIVLGAKHSGKFESFEQSLNIILKFANNIKNIKFSDVKGYGWQNLKYNSKIKKERLKNNLGKLTINKRVASFLLASTFFVNLGINLNNNDYKANDIKSNEMIEQEFFEEMYANEASLNEKLEENYIENIIEPEKNDLQILLEDYNLTENEFNVLCAIVLSEAKANSYDDAYAVINTIYNRCQSNKWVNYVDNILGEGKGRNLYYQAILPGQFIVYDTGRYLKNLNNKNSIGYSAIIDFLNSKECIHDYLSFRSSNTNVINCVQFDENGNKYFDVMLEEDRIDDNQFKMR